MSPHGFPRESHVGDSGSPRARHGTVPLRCSCGCTYAHLREDGALVIVSRHHGQKCVNVVTQQDLVEFRPGSGAEDNPSSGHSSLKPSS